MKQRTMVAAVTMWAIAIAFDSNAQSDNAALLRQVDHLVQRSTVLAGASSFADSGGRPRGVHVNVHEGERVRAGEQLMDGPSNPHDILRVPGEKELQKYLVNEIQEVYRQDRSPARGGPTHRDHGDLSSGLGTTPLPW